MHLVLLHALPLDGATWTVDPGWPVDSVLAPTLYGLGETLGEWADAVIDLAGPGPLVVAGCSVGGSCALEVARRVPSRIAALVLVGTKATPRPDPVARDHAVRLLTERGGPGAWTELWQPLFGPRTAVSVIEHARDIALAQPVCDLVTGVRAFHDREDRADVVRSLRCPLAVVSGADDRTPGPQVAAALAGDAAAGELNVVPDCGHYVDLERPRVWGALLSAILHARRSSSPRESVRDRP